jgi:hypothetical protein
LHARAKRPEKRYAIFLLCPILLTLQQVLDAFHKIIEFTQPHEPEVLRYVVTLPVDDTTGTVLYMIEEYAATDFYSPFHGAYAS